MSRALAVLIACTLAGCATPRVITTPEHVETVRRIYVSIPSALVQQHDIASGPLRECPAVAAKRKAALESCNARLREIDAIEGTPVEQDD